MNFHGVQLSEAMCFGIGAGLGIWYLDLAGSSPSRLVHVRSADIEEQFFTRIGYPFNWELFYDPLQSEHALCAAVDRGVPALIRTDIYYLPYYRSSTHFPGHVIVVWGYDKGRKTFIVTDTEKEDPIEVGFEDMRKARFQDNGFFQMQGNLFAPFKISVPADLADVIRRAISFNSRVILDETGEVQGITGLKKWETEIMAWADYPDWQWTARFTYQVIERRGTGGGGFRFLYADFLQQAQEYVPEVSSRGLPGLMRDLGFAWQDLAFALKRLSENSQAELGEVAEKLQVVRQKELSYHTRAVSLAGI